MDQTLLMVTIGLLLLIRLSLRIVVYQLIKHHGPHVVALGSQQEKLMVGQR